MTITWYIMGVFYLKHKQTHPLFLEGLDKDVVGKEKTTDM